MGNRQPSAWGTYAPSLHAYLERAVKITNSDIILVLVPCYCCYNRIVKRKYTKLNDAIGNY